MPQPSIIVIEGPDGTGKSTLARHLSSLIGWEILHSGGPEKHLDEINERAAMFSQLTNVIFDRHPCVSHPIYNAFRSIPQTRLDPAIISHFYAVQRPFMIYACEPVGVEVMKPEHDTPEHRDFLDKNLASIRQAYHQWAIERAHCIYRPHSAGWASSIACAVWNMVEG